jgi:hypothetical protein
MKGAGSGQAGCMAACVGVLVSADVSIKVMQSGHDSVYLYNMQSA